MPTVHFIARLLREQPLRFSLVVMSAGVAGLLDGLWIGALVPMLDVLGGNGVTGSAIGEFVSSVLGVFGLPLELVPVLGLVLVLLLLQQLAMITQQKIAFGSIYRFEADLRRRLYRTVFEAGWPFFVSEKTTNLVNALTVESQRASGAYNYLNQMLGMGLVVIAYSVLALTLSVQMTILVVSAAAIFMVVLRRRVSRGTRFGLNVTALNQDVQGAASETISGAKLVKGVGAELSAVDRFTRATQSLAHEQYRLQMNQAWVKVTYDALSAVLVVSSIWIATARFAMPLSELIVFLIIFARLAPRISNFALLQHNILAYLPSLDRVDELTADASAMREATGERRLARFSDAIDLRGVTFGYDPDHPVVHDLDLSIQCGKTTAVVGPSGAGKTTIIDLVMRLILPQSGAAAVDGVDMAALDVADWRRRIGYVAQDAVLFHASIAENIRFGNPDASDEQVREAAILAYADEFISAMPEGYDTVVGDRGVRLSGGQRQRIALARAIVRRPEILILDEATSALDSESEERIQDAVSRLAGDVTVLVVTHRLATVRGADVIYVLDGGKIVEQGSFEELVSRGGRFEELRRLQALQGDVREA